MGRTIRWRLGVLAAIAMTLLALVPQAHLWRARGLAAWHGAYASFDGDETAYAAYLAALIEGRPRLNDPYTGIDDSNATPLAESLFSIQFVPAYALALPARALGLRAPTVFIALSPLVAFASTLALFWLLTLLINDERLAACAAIIVLCLGTLASGQVNLVSLVQLRPAHAYLPFLRRYVPALPFPFLFLFCALLWRALRRSNERRAAYAYAVAAGATFALLVYSYFYLWTTAAAWLAALALVWLAAARRERDAATQQRHAPKVFLTTAALALLSLVPYALLVARRAATMDKVQVLKFTHAPDLFRAPEIIALAALAALAAGVWLKRLEARDAPVLFAASFALTPFVVFNQQIITGRSLQPVHYEDYVLNYLALLALTLALALCVRRRDASERATVPRRAVWMFLCVALAAYGWATFELIATTRRFSPVNAARDEQARVASRLSELAHAPATNDPQLSRRPVVLTENLMLADNLPVFAPRASVLWSPHTHVNSGLTADEHRERMYQFFYYTGVVPENFHAYLRANPLIIYKLFGAEHVLPRLTTDYAPLSDEEINREGRAYAAYVAAFTREQAARPALSFVITSRDSPADFSKLDRWYERDAGVSLANYTIYRVRLRP
ncbi:MAG TPA: hypothetical protein VER76_07130 [Pyrinomonadaceae bacterium]|nr:hypothetical protein [Pyrinomonadaceae bacterium]